VSRARPFRGRARFAHQQFASADVRRPGTSSPRKFPA